MNKYMKIGIDSDKHKVDIKAELVGRKIPHAFEEDYQWYVIPLKSDEITCEEDIRTICRKYGITPVQFARDRAIPEEVFSCV